MDTIVIGERMFQREKSTNWCRGCVAKMGEDADLCMSLSKFNCTDSIWKENEEYGLCKKQEEDEVGDGFYGGSEDYIAKAEKALYEGRNSAFDYDIVKKPKHYMLFEDKNIEVRDVIEKLVGKLQDGNRPYCCDSPLFESDYVQLMQYLMRFMDKNGKQDLEKARWYLDKMIEAY